MLLWYVSLLALAVSISAVDVATEADFEKACQANQIDCVDNSEDMYLIQKKIEVGTQETMVADGASHSKKAEWPTLINPKMEEKHEKKAAHEEKEKRDRGLLMSSSSLQDDDVDKLAGKSSEDPVETTKGGDDKAAGGDDSADGADLCPEGFIAEPGNTPEEEVFGEAPESVAKSKTDCAADCKNHSVCAGFEFDDKKSKCLLSTSGSPSSEFAKKENKDIIFCAKDACSKFVWPWHYYNETDSIEGNAWNAWNTAHRCWYEWLVWCLITWLIWVVLGLLIWKLCFGDNPEVFEDVEDPIYVFEAGHFDCGRHLKICLCAFCCPAVQWAMSMHFAGFLHVGAALGAYFVLGFFNGFVEDIGFFPFGIFTSILVIVYRQKLRTRLGIMRGTPSTLFFDTVYVCCCPCCAVAQEAAVINNAWMKSNVRSQVQWASREAVPEVRVIRDGVPSPSGRVIQGSQARVITSGNTMPISGTGSTYTRPAGQDTFISRGRSPGVRYATK
jgi:Cys-rich protein (TIGR01571 family)